jgi:non-heme chloroperoxidase
MTFLIEATALTAVIALLVVATAFFLVGSPAPLTKGCDVFGFATPEGMASASVAPPLKRYPARDGTELAYRFYDSAGERLLIFLHGSSYHGAAYHTLASWISGSGAAKVVLPNLRGHFQSGRRRGDVDYIGQLEDDLVDLIRLLRHEGRQGPIVLAGHSSGGGLAIRFAGGRHDVAIARYLLLAPIILGSPSIRGGTAGGWSNVHWRRLVGLIALNILGVHGFNALPLVEFSKPEHFWDGTETLAYSYRLNVSYHPRHPYPRDMRALEDKALILIGENDEAIDASVLAAAFASHAPQSRVVALPHVNHFGVFKDQIALATITEWLDRRGSTDS